MGTRGNCPGAHEHRAMLIYACCALYVFLWIKHWLCWKYQYNIYIYMFNFIYIYSFIPMSGCVGIGHSSLLFPGARDVVKNLNIFCKRQISIKLFDLYQRLQCRDYYFFKIKFVFFLYLRLSWTASSKENDLPLCIYFWYQTDSGVPNTSIYSAISLAFPYYNCL